MKPGVKLVDLGIDLRWRVTDLTGSRRFAVWLFTIPLRLAALLDLILITLLSILHFGLIRTAQILQVVLHARPIPDPSAPSSSSGCLLPLSSRFLAYIVALVGMEAPLDASARLHAASEAHAYAAAVLDFADHALNAFVDHYGLQRTLADLSKPLRALADLELELVTLPDWSTKYEASETLERVLTRV